MSWDGVIACFIVGVIVGGLLAVCYFIWVFSKMRW